MPLQIQIGANTQQAEQAIVVLNNQLDRLAKLASLPGLNVNQYQRIQDLANQTNRSIQQLSNSHDILDERIRHVASAQHEFARLTGELPALLSGATGGTQLLGSELYVLATGIQRAREAGQGFGSIFAQLGESLFSVQGLILVGIGLFTTFGDKIFKVGDGFSAAEINAARFTEEINNAKTAMDEFISSLDFEAAINKLKAELTFGKGTTADLAGSLIDTQKNNEIIETANNNINQLAERIGYLRSNAALLLSKKGQDVLHLFYIDDQIPDDFIKKLSQSDAKIINEIKAAGIEKKQEEEKRQKASQENAKIETQTQVNLNEADKKLVQENLKTHEEADKKAAELAKKRLEELKRIQEGILTLREKMETELSAGIKQPVLKSPKADIGVGDIESVQDNINKIKEQIGVLQSVNGRVLGADLTSEIDSLKQRLALLEQIKSVTLQQPAITNREKLGFIQDAEKYKTFFEGLKKQATETANVISQALESSINSFVNAIKSGQSPVKAFFNSIIDAIQQTVVKFIAAQIQAAIFKAILGAATGGTANLGQIASGFNFSHHAGGGPIGAGEVSWVGENGPELFVSKSSGTIIPNGRSTGMSAAQPQVMYIEGRLSLREIVLGVARELKYQSRNV